MEELLEGFWRDMIGGDMIAGFLFYENIWAKHNTVNYL